MYYPAGQLYDLILFYHKNNTLFKAFDWLGLTFTIQMSIRHQQKALQNRKKVSSTTLSLSKNLIRTPDAYHE